MANVDYFEKTKEEFTQMNIDFRIRNMLKISKKMTPIEGIMFLTLLDLIDSFGRNNINFMPQVKIDRYTVDFLIEYTPIDNDAISKKIIIECDGHDFHEKTKKQAAHDKNRDRFFTKKGYTILRYTGSEIVKDRYKVLSDVEEMLIPEQHKNRFGYGEEYEKMLKELRF